MSYASIPIEAGEPVAPPVGVHKAVKVVAVGLGLMLGCAGVASYAQPAGFSSADRAAAHLGGKAKKSKGSKASKSSSTTGNQAWAADVWATDMANFMYANYAQPTKGEPDAGKAVCDLMGAGRETCATTDNGSGTGTCQSVKLDGGDETCDAVCSAGGPNMKCVAAYNTECDSCTAWPYGTPTDCSVYGTCDAPLEEIACDAVNSGRNCKCENYSPCRQLFRYTKDLTGAYFKEGGVAAPGSDIFNSATVLDQNKLHAAVQTTSAITISDSIGYPEDPAGAEWMSFDAVTCRDNPLALEEDDSEVCEQLVFMGDLYSCDDVCTGAGGTCEMTYNDSFGSSPLYTYQCPQKMSEVAGEVGANFDPTQGTFSIPSFEAEITEANGFRVGGSIFNCQKKLWGAICRCRFPK